MTDTTGRARLTVRPKVDNSALVKRADSRDAQKRGPEVPRRIRAAAELLTAQPCKLDYAALAVQLGYRNARALRKALSLPQTVRFLQEFKRDVLAKINMANPEALRAIRDTSGNDMAKVQAIRTHYYVKTWREIHLASTKPFENIV